MFDHETAEIEQVNLEDDALTLDELTEIMHGYIEVLVLPKKHAR